MQKRLKKFLSAFITIASSWLHKPEASKELSYLQSRIPPDKIKQFDFGYFPFVNSSIIEFIDEFAKLIDEDPIIALKDCGIVYQKYNKLVPFFKYHRVLIPFFDVYGSPASIAARTLLDDSQQKIQNIGKYKYLPFDKRRHLFGLNYSYKNVVKYDKIVITEGQFDFYSAFINNLTNVAAVGGSKFTFEQITLLKRFTNNVIVVFDNDEAGNIGKEKIIKNASKYGLKIQDAKLPNEFHDLDDFVKSGNSLNELIK